MIYLELFLGFLEVGLFSFGGAYAAIPLIRDVVLSYGWLTDEALGYMIAVSESTPGPIMINLATYVGSQKGELLGAVVATLGVVLPAFVIILALTSVMNAFSENPYVKAVLSGLKPCVVGIILAVGVYMTLNGCLKALPDVRFIISTVILAGIMILYKVVFKKKISPILFIGISALLGIVIYAL